LTWARLCWCCIWLRRKPLCHIGHVAAKRLHSRDT
jgi:hypothetical protein